MHLAKTIASILGILGALGTFVAWLMRWWRNSSITSVFIHDMATNHLPHIYHALRLLMQKEGISMEEPPPVIYIPPDKFKLK